MGLKRYFLNTSWMLLEKVVRLGIALTVGVYIARYLGPEDYGVLSYAQSFAALFSALATLGLDAVLVKAFVEGKKQSIQLLGTALVLKALGALVAWGGVIILLFILGVEEDLRNLVYLVSFGFLFQSTGVIAFFFQSRVESKYTVCAQLLSVFFSALLRIFLIYSACSVKWFALSIALEQFLLGVFLVFQYRRKVGRIRDWQIQLSLGRDLLSKSWPLILSGIVISVYMRIDQIMIKQMMSSAHVGIYSAACRLSEAWYFVPSVISASLFPAMLSVRGINSTLYLSRMQSFYSLMVTISLCVALPTSFFAGQIIELLYGNDFELSSAVLVIHIWSGLFVSIRIVSGKWLIAEGMVRKSFYRSFSGALLNIALNLMLIPTFGIIGAAWASLLAHLFSGLIYDAFDVETREQFVLKLRALFFINVFFNSRRRLM